MNGRQLTLTYLVTYLIGGGLGFAFFPDLTLKLFLSNGNYGTIMPRLTGIFMCGLGFLVYHILRHKDWKYYVVSIYARSGIVLFMLYLYFISLDLMFIIFSVIILVGLIPSLYIHYLKKSDHASPH